MPTFIHGIAASENIDSSGERIIIAGLDSSSLEKDGVFNWEHKADQPGQVVGKVLKARKIFSEDDCEDEHQLHFFKKCGVPYLYVMGELMDDYKESAKEVAGQFKYDADRANQVATANFSIEGAKIDKQGMDIVKSIARKVTITVLACNKAAVASIVPVKKGSKSDDLNSLFKTESIEAEILKYESLEKTTKIPAKPLAAAPATMMGTKIGMIGGKSILSTHKPMDWHGSDVNTFRGVRDAHFNASNATKDNKLKMFHMDQSKRFEQAASRLEGRQAASAKALAPKLGLGQGLGQAAQPAKAPGTPSVPTTPPSTAAMPRTPTTKAKPPGLSDIKSDKLFDPRMSGTSKPAQLAKPPMTATPAKTSMKKALDAGSGLTSAPSQLTGGAALAKEDLKVHMAPVMKPQGVKASAPGAKHGSVKFSSKVAPIKKSKWLARAEDEYNKWEKREQFEQFMSKRMPHITKGEVRAIGQVMALNKAMTLEKALSSLSDYNKSEKDPSDKKK